MNAILQKKQISNVLAIGAHPDDIEIGCGGTIIDLFSRKTDVEIRWEVFSGAGQRRNEAIGSANEILEKSNSSVFVSDFRDSFFPEQWSEIKKRFAMIADEFQPDIVLTHHLDDRHQDHRVLAELTWNAFRNHLILEYEIPKYEGDLVPKNCFVGFDEKTAENKIELLWKHFKTQQEKTWFEKDVFRGLMRVRGIESPDSDKYAEAFYCRKFSLGF